MTESSDQRAARAGATPAAPIAERARRAGPVQVVKAVLSAFIGIRRRAAHENDLATLSPVQVIVTGIIAAAVFVLGLVALVNFVTS